MRYRIALLALTTLGLVACVGATLAAIRSQAQPPLASVAAVPGGGTVTEPWLVVTPTSLAAQVPAGEQQTQPLFVGNASPTSTLAYTIAILPVAQARGIVDWLYVTPTQGLVPIGGVAVVDVTFDAADKPAGFLDTASLRVASNSLVTPTAVTVPILIDVIEATVLPTVDPAALSAKLLLGATASQTLILSNQGNATLHFSLTLASDPAVAAVSWLEVSPLTGTVAPGASRGITATFNSSGLLPGPYGTELLVGTNSQVTPLITVPITMTVSAPAHYVGPIYDGPELDYQPAIIRVQPGGQLWVIFERLNPSSLFGDLYLTTSADGGQTWSEPAPVIDSPLNERHPALVQLGDDSFALFYLVDETGAGSYRIHRATSSDGLLWTDRGAIDLGWASAGEVNPAVICEADGTLTMTYHRFAGPSFLARSVDGGATWDTLRTQVSEGSAALPRLAKRESDGLYLVTYQVNPEDNNLDLYAKVSSDPYDWSGTPISVSTEINTHDSQPIVLEDGAFLVVYAKTPVNYFDVFYKISCDGLTWSEEIQVTDDPAHYDTQPHPLLYGLPGHLILNWSHQESAIPYQDHDVWIDNDLPLRPSLCGSSKAVAPAFFEPGQRLLTYTLYLRDSGMTTTATLVDPIPVDTVFQPGSLWASSGQYGYDPVGQAITWTGIVSTGAEITLSFQVSTTVVLEDGDGITNTAWLTDATGLAHRVEALAVADGLPPASEILDPQDGQFINSATYLVTGQAADSVSYVEVVSVSIDGGPWQSASGQESWAFEWEGLTEGQHNLRSRATDPLGHVEIPGVGITVTVDFTQPELVAVQPAGGSVGVPLTASVILTFSEPILAGTLGFESEPPLTGWSFSWNEDATVAYLSHADFAPGQTYTFTVTGALDRAGNPLAASAWSFTTAGCLRFYLPIVLRSHP